jgi:hypothetical protein
MPDPTAPALAAIALAGVVAGCSLIDVETVTGSGALEEVSHDLAGFDSVEVRRGVDVRLRPGQAFEVISTSDDNITRYVEVDVNGDTLELDIDDGVNLRNATVAIDVVMPTLTELRLRSGAAADLRDFELEALDVSLAGGSELACASLEVGRAALDLSGGSDVRCEGLRTDALDAELGGGSELVAAGSSATLSLDAGGGSDVDLGRLEAVGAEVRLSASSEALVNVSGVLEADLSNGAELRYLGSPTLGTVDLSGGATIDGAG